MNVTAQLILADGTTAFAWGEVVCLGEHPQVSYVEVRDEKGNGFSTSLSELNRAEKALLEQYRKGMSCQL